MHTPSCPAGRPRNEPSAARVRRPHGSAAVPRGPLSVPLSGVAVAAVVVSPPGSRGRGATVVIAWLATMLLGAGGAAGEGAFRVESEIFVDGAKEPVARSLTLFRDGVAWDFLEVSPAEKPEPPASGSGGEQLGEIVLHDPARERIILVDPRRNVKTRIDAIRLERLSVSLASWARKSDDRLVRWSGGPDFGEGMTETKDRLELVGPRVRYDVELTAAASPEIARRYRRFADTAILLKALVRPGGLPPFPRLAINRRLEAADALPTSVALEIDARGFPLSARADRVKCVHRFHPRLLTGDIERIEEAESRVAVSDDVDLAAFVAAAPKAD